MRILFLFLLSLNATADIRLPSKYFDLSQIVAPYKELIKDKIEQLEQNFIQREKGTLRSFLSVGSTNCQNGITLTRNELIGSIQYLHSSSVRNKKETLKEIVEYRGCRNKINFIEEIYTEGIKLEKMKWPEVRLSKTRIKIQKNEDARVYRLMTSTREEVLKISQEKIGLNKYKTIFYNLRQPVVVMIDDFTDGHSKEIVELEYQLNNVNVSFEGSNFSFNGGNSSNTRVRARVDKESAITFLDNNGQQLSFNSFVEFVSKIKDTISEKMTSFYRFGWSQSYPQTKFAGGGDLNARLLEELRLNQTRLLTNTQLNLVTLYIQELIQAVTNSEIQDKREPKKKK